MQSIEIAQTPADSPTNNRTSVFTSWSGDRRVLAVVGLAISATGLAIGWDWLTAVGIAPLIVSAAPCLVMCALGLCVIRRNQQACSSEPAPGAGEPSTHIEPSAGASLSTLETCFVRRDGTDR